MQYVMCIVIVMILRHTITELSVQILRFLVLLVMKLVRCIKMLLHLIAKLFRLLEFRNLLDLNMTICKLIALKSYMIAPETTTLQTFWSRLTYFCLLN